MSVPEPAPSPLSVQCRGCGATAGVPPGTEPDDALECGCCPLDHGHTGACRPLLILAAAQLSARTGQEGVS
jgi:hypothetical protein